MTQLKPHNQAKRKQFMWLETERMALNELSCVPPDSKGSSVKTFPFSNDWPAKHLLFMTNYKKQYRIFQVILLF